MSSKYKDPARYPKVTLKYEEEFKKKYETNLKKAFSEIFKKIVKL